MFALKKRNNNKRFLLGLCALIVAVAMVSIGVTLAFEAQNPYETNVVVLGNIDIELVDEYIGNEDPYDEDNPPVFGPDTTVDKKVSVTNTGNHPCYVRILMRKIWKTDDGDNLSNLIEYDINKAYWYTEGETYTIPKKGNETEDRVYQVYYYKDILGVGETAEPLITEFHIKDYNDTTVYSGGFRKVAGTVGDIQVLAQAVQSENVKCTPLNMGGMIIQAKAPGGYYDEDPDIVYIQRWNFVFD